MTASFNLVASPWIPCVTLHGDTVHLGLMDALLRSHELREIADPSPLIVASLHRLALAILHRVFGPANRAAWGELWRAGRWPEKPLQRYFDQWYERFDLFHPEHPFFQAPDERVKPKSVLHLIYSTGNNPTLFSHETDEQAKALSAAEAARALLASQTFHIAGLSGLEEKFTDAPWTRGVCFLVQGETLFQTLALNLIRYPESEGRVQDNPSGSSRVGSGQSFHTRARISSRLPGLPHLAQCADETDSRRWPSRLAGSLHDHRTGATPER